MMLERKGYSVLSRNHTDRRPWKKQHTPFGLIDMLMTDVVMPD